MSIHRQEDEEDEEILKLPYYGHPLLGFGINRGDNGKPHLVTDYLTKEDHGFKEEKDDKPQNEADEKLLGGSQGYGQGAIRDRYQRWDKGEEETGQNQGKSHLCPLGYSPIAKEGDDEYQSTYPNKQQAEGENPTGV